jgi:hypothetical protein
MSRDQMRLLTAQLRLERQARDELRFRAIHYADLVAELHEEAFKKWQQDTIFPDAVNRWIAGCCV